MNNRMTCVLISGLLMMTGMNFAGETKPILNEKATAFVIKIETSDAKLTEAKQKAALQLGEWIGNRRSQGESAAVIIVCTGNSRRSMLGAVMGDVAATHFGMSEVRFYSGGTAPSAFNKRTIASLRRAGVVIEPTDKTGMTGKAGEENRKYRVQWTAQGSEPSLEVIEYSKHYADEANPQEGFAAVMVCDEADGACPVVKGAVVRISAPFEDPKWYDDTVEEGARYDQRRDEIAKFMLTAMKHAKEVAGKK